MDNLTFTAILNKVQTTVDGGWRISFDVSQDEAEKMTEITKHRDSALMLAVVPIKDDNG